MEIVSSFRKKRNILYQSIDLPLLFVKEPYIIQADIRSSDWTSSLTLAISSFCFNNSIPSFFIFDSGRNKKILPPLFNHFNYYKL
nr:hypothetical protein [Escherichia coli]